MLAENTLLKTAYLFLLLLVGFDTLTYRKDYDRSPILVGVGAVNREDIPTKPINFSAITGLFSCSALVFLRLFPLQVELSIGCMFYFC